MKNSDDFLNTNETIQSLQDRANKIKRSIDTSRDKSERRMKREYDKAIDSLNNEYGKAERENNKLADSIIHDLDKSVERSEKKELNNKFSWIYILLFIIICLLIRLS